jgi:hypothetical protein
MAQTGQLISYIAPAAPATRRPAEGNEPFLRPEIGFTPKWYREALGIDFGERWHTDPVYRRDAIIAIRAEFRRRYAGTAIGGVDRPDAPIDLLTGVYGASTVAAIYGIPIIYSVDNWPNCAHQYLSDDEVDAVAPPDLDTNPHFQALMQQVDWIAANQGMVIGYVNWQGVLNNAQRLRGEPLFIDMMEEPDRCARLFDAVTTTMIDAAKRLHSRQRETGVEVRFFTVSNCLVNMVSSRIYREQLLPCDKRIADAFESIGIHNCAWNADPYLDAYAEVPRVAYIDMGIMSDLSRVRSLFPDARRALMYTPMDVANKSLDEIRSDFQHIADAYGPCDIVLADIEAGTPDDRVLALVEICESISTRQTG